MNQSNFIMLRFFTLVSFTMLLLCNCTKNQNIVPYVHVDQVINISLPSYSSLNTIGGWKYISGGSQGIIIYRQSYDQFSAYSPPTSFCSTTYNNTFIFKVKSGQDPPLVKSILDQLWQLFQLGF